MVRRSHTFDSSGELVRLREQVRDPQLVATLAGHLIQDGRLIDYAREHGADARDSVRFVVGKDSLVAVGRSQADVIRVLDHIKGGLERKTLPVSIYTHPSETELGQVAQLAQVWSSALPALPPGLSRSTPKGDTRKE
jgi:hypothetical protein